MTIELDRAALLAFRDRRWDLVRESKLAYWAEQTRVNGPLPGLEASAALWVHARTVDPSWPSDRERREDFEHHIELAAKLRRVADTKRTHSTSLAEAVHSAIPSRS